MRTLLRSTILTLVLLSATAYGWNRHGHLLVSTIAYQTLKSDPSAAATLAKINTILKSHPYAGKWTDEYEAAPAIHARISLEAYFFIRAAAWPDEVRDDPKESVDDWHFINYHVTLPKIDFTANDPKNNIFIGTAAALNVIIDSKAADLDKARMLSWLFHLVGDVHQPLHSVALWANGHGDAGGNAECIMTAGGPEVLHHYWDASSGVVAGEANDVAAVWKQANDIIAANPAVKPADFDTAFDMVAWSKESANLAVSNAYQFNGQVIQTVPMVYVQEMKDGQPVIVNGKPKMDHVCADPKTQAYVSVPDKYESTARDIAAMRILKAGYRLKNELTTIMH